MIFFTFENFIAGRVLKRAKNNALGVSMKVRGAPYITMGYSQSEGEAMAGGREVN